MASSDRLRVLSEDPQSLGRDLVRNFQVALRTSRTHGWNNEASKQAVSRLATALGGVHAARGEYAVHAAGDFVYLDDTRLRVEGLGQGYLEQFVAELTQLALGSLFVYRQPSENEVRAFLDLLNQYSPGTDDTPNQVNDQTERLDIPFSVGPFREINELASVETEQVHKRERCKKAFFKAVTVTQAVMRSAHLGKRLELRHAKRVVQNMVDLMMDEEFTLMGLTTLKDHDNYTFYHSVNVCIYSLALAKRAGFTKTQLPEIGVAALFHDLGKSKVPLDVLHKSGAFTPVEWEVMRQHPEMGVKEMVRMRGLSSLAYKSMVACFEHHLNYNQAPGGYPKLRESYRPHVLGRIVAIADCFDAMTTKRVYVKKATPRDKALSYMMSQAGTKFDPVLLRLFANMVGVFPVGTAVRLASGRLAVVVATHEDEHLCHRPRVLPITDETGIQRESPEIDLSEELPGGGYADEVVSTVEPEELGLDISKYFI